MFSSTHRRSSGFTLVELLVVIAIIGTLVGLLLPAVQAAREAARLTSCANNMKQLGVAVAHFESVKKKYPSGRYDDRSGTGWSIDVYNPGGATSAHYQILPFMEQQALYDASSLSTNAMIPGLICPSVNPPGRNDKRTCYLFSNGDALATENTGFHKRGIVAGGMGWNGSSDFWKNPYYRQAKDVTDGLSNTIFLAERCYGAAGPSSDVRFGRTNAAAAPSAANYDTCLNSASGLTYVAGTTGSDIGDDWASWSPGHTTFNTVFPPNGPTCGGSFRGDYAGGPTATSMHSAGGVNAVFGDGSVRFISQMIDAGGPSYANWNTFKGLRNDSLVGASPYGVWGALGSINGTEAGMMSQIQ